MEEFGGRLFVRVQRSIEQLVRESGRKLGIETVEKNAHGISLLVITIIVLGSLWAYTRLYPDKAPSSSIQGDHNIIINISAETLNVPPEKIERSIDKIFSGRKRRQIEKDAITIMTPPKSQDGATVEFPGIFTVNPASIAELPPLEMLEPDSDRKYEVLLQHVPIFIRTTNLDNNKSGWAGLVRIDETSVRLRMILPDDADRVRLRYLPENEPMMADAIVYYREDKHGNFVPTFLQVTKIY
ncbi:hypothetical protein [Marinimicrococcus flavescens]|uniref:Uncharacterized protein n=1 Tax=Marinimicrococcus flavescens TaxID=3031815 RepID=A0AAP4D727_9PROT|nr:hypothetical protein [Marinimicrococcus flavescens]